MPRKIKSVIKPIRIFKNRILFIADSVRSETCAIKTHALPKATVFWSRAGEGADVRGHRKGKHPLYIPADMLQRKNDKERG